MTKNQRHIWVNPERIADPSASTLPNGVEIEVALGPYDVPTELTGEYDPASGEFTIKFDYIDQEPSSSKPRVLDGVQFLEGRHSGKLLKITIPVDSPEMRAVSVIKTTLLKALETRKESSASRPISLTQTLNQNLAVDVLKEGFENLAPEAMCSS